MAYAVQRNGGRIVEVPISFSDRVRGTSKMSSRIVVEALGLVTWWGIRDRLLRRGKPRYWRLMSVTAPFVAVTRAFGSTGNTSFHVPAAAHTSS